MAHISTALTYNTFPFPSTHVCYNSGGGCSPSRWIDERLNELRSGAWGSRPPKIDSSGWIDRRMLICNPIFYGDGRTGGSDRTEPTSSNSRSGRKHGASTGLSQIPTCLPVYLVSCRQSPQCAADSASLIFYSCCNCAFVPLPLLPSSCRRPFRITFISRSELPPSKVPMTAPLFSPFSITSSLQPKDSDPYYGATH